MAFELPTPTAQAQAVSLANLILGRFNDFARQDTARFRMFWEDFWSDARSIEVQQAFIDLLASTPATDPIIGATNCLNAMFAKALREITDILHENPTGLDDAPLEQTAIVADDGTVTGINALQPNGQPKKKYFTPGWDYSVDQTGRMVFSSPTKWGGTADEQRVRYANCQAMAAQAAQAATAIDTVISQIQGLSSVPGSADFITQAVAQGTVAHDAATAAATAVASVDVVGVTARRNTAERALDIAQSALNQVLLLENPPPPAPE